MKLAIRLEDNKEFKKFGRQWVEDGKMMNKKLGRRWREIVWLFWYGFRINVFDRSYDVRRIEVEDGKM